MLVPEPRAIKSGRGKELDIREQKLKEREGAAEKVTQANDAIDKQPEGQEAALAKRKAELAQQERDDKTATISKGAEKSNALKDRRCLG